MLQRNKKRFLILTLYASFISSETTSLFFGGGTSALKKMSELILAHGQMFEIQENEWKDSK